MKKNKSVLLAAAAVALGVALAGCAKSADSGGAEGGKAVNLPAIDKVDVPSDAVWAKGKGGATCDPTTTIAYIGAVTGPNAQLGINIFQGVKQAIAEHNAANPNCQVQYTQYDTEGDPNKATGPVTQAVTDNKIIGVVGLPFSGESKATGNIFDEKGLVHVTPAATNPKLTENGWKTFFRGLGNDAVQGPAAAKFITGKLEAKKVFVVQDDSEYGIGLADNTKKALGEKLAGEEKFAAGQKDFSTIVSKIQNSKADAVFFSGYYADAVPFVQQLKAKGYTGSLVTPDGVKDDEYIKQAGESSAGTYFTCPCIPGELIPDFKSSYEKVSGGKAPGTYSIEGYDATVVLLQGIDSGKKTRAELLDYVKSYNASGLSKKYKWNEKGELEAPAVYGYKAENGKIVPVGPIG